MMSGLSNLRLMIPGPTEVSPEVCEQMALPMKPHYGEEWSRYYFQTVDKVKTVFQTENDLYIFAATSSAGMEVGVSHAVEPGEKILICNNGFFGDRFTEMAQQMGAEIVTTRSEYGQAITVEQVQNVLKKHPDIKALAIVHNESSTAVESELGDITECAQKAGVLTIVDCVSSMGGVDVPTDKLGIDFCISGTQKCFGAPPGLGFLSVSKRAWDRIKKRKSPLYGWYLNLTIMKQYRERWTHWHPQGPNTSSVSLYLALNQAIDEIFAEGLQERFARHISARNAFRAAMLAMGLKLFVRDEIASKTLTAICLPENIDGSTVRKNIQERHKILVAGGIGSLANSLIRVGHLSRTATAEYIISTIAAIEEELARAGASIHKGIAADVFRKEFEKCESSV